MRKMIGVQKEQINEPLHRRAITFVCQVKCSAVPKTAVLNTEPGETVYLKNVKFKSTS